jgi:hypothetical protein
MNYGKDDHEMRTMAQFEEDERQRNLQQWQPEREPSTASAGVKPAMVDDLQFVPEPYRAMIKTIEPDDLYIVQRINGSGEPRRIRRIEAAMPASQAQQIEIGMSGNNLSTERFRGRDLRTFFLELARAHDHFIGPVMVNPRV